MWQTPPVVSLLGHRGELHTCTTNHQNSSGLKGIETSNMTKKSEVEETKVPHLSSDNDIQAFGARTFEVLCSECMGAVRMRV